MHRSGTCHWQASLKEKGLRMLPIIKVLINPKWVFGDSETT